MAENEIINITPGICFVNSHQKRMLSQCEGSAIIYGNTYVWFGGCQLCVNDKLEEIRNENL